GVCRKCLGWTVSAARARRAGEARLLDRPRCRRQEGLDARDPEDLRHGCAAVRDGERGAVLDGIAAGGDEDVDAGAVEEGDAREGGGTVGAGGGPEVLELRLEQRCGDEVDLAGCGDADAVAIRLNGDRERGRL